MTSGTSKTSDPFFDDDDEGWQDMPIVREDDPGNPFDEEDAQKYHYISKGKQDKSGADGAGNATGNLIDFDDDGIEWREKKDTNESEYTRLRLNEEDENDEVHMRTKYLFDEDKAMTPLSQMQATKNFLTESQRIAYVGLCSLTCLELSQLLKATGAKELKGAVENLELWALKIMGRLYHHMELETPEQKMIESLSEHGVQAGDLVPPLMTTHTVANPEYDPAEARRQASIKRNHPPPAYESEPESDAQTITIQSKPSGPLSPPPTATKFQTTANVLTPNVPVSVPGVSTSLSTTDEKVTLDIRWTVLCDLFLILIADSVYDARSRVLLETVAQKLGLGWLDVVKFEQRVTEALEIQEGVEKLEQKEVIEGRMKAARKKRYAMMGLATLGGGLVIGLSAGLLAPVIGLGLGAAFTTIGVTGTTGFLAGAGGAAVITTAGTLTGSSIAARGMARRTQQVKTFDLLPLHNNKRVNCILTVSGFMTSSRDDVRLPFSVLDPIVGDVFSVLWDPEMLGETGSALKILTSEVLSQVGTTVLQATVMTALMSALQWPILLTKLGYLIDNPWSNALDRAKAAGAVLADVLINRHLGVRPITLIGFSLGARVIFYCLVELARQKAFGIVQDVFLLGGTFTASHSTWLQTRSVVAGRFVNGYARNDWLLNYLFRATNAGLNSIAGLRPVQGVPGLENIDVTDKIAGHTSYRAFMPLILDQLGFPVSADYFDEPEEPDMVGDRVVIRESEEKDKKKSWFSRKDKNSPPKKPVRGGPPSYSSSAPVKSNQPTPTPIDDELPEREEKVAPQSTTDIPLPSTSKVSTDAVVDPQTQAPIPTLAGFDLKAIQDVIDQEGDHNHEAAQRSSKSDKLVLPPLPPPTNRSESAPPLKLVAEKQETWRATEIVRRISLDAAHSETLAKASEDDLSHGFEQNVSLGSREVGNSSQAPEYEEEELDASLTAGPSARSPSEKAASTTFTRDSDGADSFGWSDYAPVTSSFGGLHSNIDSRTAGEYGGRDLSNTANTSLSFGRTNDGGLWNSGRTSNGNSFVFGENYSGFAAVPDRLVYESGINSSRVFSTSSPSPHLFSSTSLSFGSQGGSMISPSEDGEREMWSPPPLTKKSTSNLSTNPWE